MASRPPAAAASNHSSSSAKKKASRSRSEQSNDRLQGTEGTVVCAKPNCFGSSSLFFDCLKGFFRYKYVFCVAKTRQIDTVRIKKRIRI